MIVEEKRLARIGIHDIEALVSRKNHFNSSFCWESKFVPKPRMDFICGKNLNSFPDKEKCVGPIGIHDIDSLVSRKNHLTLCDEGAHLWQESSFFSR